jgi:hypothetical protein
VMMRACTRALTTYLTTRGNVFTGKSDIRCPSDIPHPITVSVQGGLDLGARIGIPAQNEASVQHPRRVRSTPRRSHRAFHSLVVPNPDHSITPSTRKLSLILSSLLPLTCLSLLTWLLLLLLRLTTRVGQASGGHGG